MIKKNLLRSLRVIAVLMFCFLWGCSSGARSKMMVRNMEPLLGHINDAARKNNDVALVRDAMPVGLLQMDGMIEADPENKLLLMTAAENYHGYAFFFVEPENRVSAAKLYQKSYDYACRVLNQNSAFKKAADGSLEDYANSLGKFTKEDVPALYWSVASRLAWMRVSRETGMDTMVEFPEMEAVMDRMLVLNETYNYGAVHALMGAYYSSIPDSFGGNSEQAAFHFNEAFEISESKYLLWDVFYAQYYAFAIKSKELYVKHLNHVINAPEDIFPEEVFANLVAKQLAEKLLIETDLRF